VTLPRIRFGIVASVLPSFDRAPAAHGGLRSVPTRGHLPVGTRPEVPRHACRALDYHRTSTINRPTDYPTLRLALLQ